MFRKILIFLYVSFVIKIVSGTFIIRDKLPKYTKIATTVDGEPCLGGCSPITKVCVTNWLWTKKPCEIGSQAAPIFFTSQHWDKNNKQCWSNCGKFGQLYDWCITSADNKWDYCSSKVRGATTPTGRSIVDTFTSIRLICESPCKYQAKTGYSCYYAGKLWAHCAKQAISRIPILPPDFNVGASDKGNCEAFVTDLIKNRDNITRFDTATAPDNYINEVAEDIETGVKSVPDSGAFIVMNNEADPVKSYTMVNVLLANGSSVLVPAVLRAKVTRSGFDEKEDESYNWRIIGYELGGSTESYNFAPQSSKFTESWSLVEQAIKKWTIDTTGSVDMLVVVFYGDEHSVTPKAFGVALSFNNPDGTAFVCCKDTIYWNK